MASQPALCYLIKAISFNLLFHARFMKEMRTDMLWGGRRPSAAASGIGTSFLCREDHVIGSARRQCSVF